MTDDIVIRAVGLGKKYLIGHQAERERYVALRDVLARHARSLARSAADLVRGRAMLMGDEVEEFWALRDVDFAIKRGEVVGVVGRNGAGKSTLLKILSRITEPSAGKVAITGRVASLLEVGTGFHPELTGRENVYLNGAILGMSSAEIRRKFDEIVAFAEVEKFLDTPVKRYSSGMYVRLAFAVAAHLEPEILVVDEVLAVGDAAFQKKSLGKIQDVAGQGRTVLFVSHNMAALENICDRGLLLSNHTVEMAAPIRDVISSYLGASVSDDVFFPPPRQEGDFHVRSVEVVDDNGEPVLEIYTWDRVRFRIEFYAPREVLDGAVEIEIATSDGRLLTFSATAPHMLIDLSFKQGFQTIDVIFDYLPFSAGEYIIGAGLAVPNVTMLYREVHGRRLTILPRDIYGTGYAPAATHYPIALPHRWTPSIEHKQGASARRDRHEA